ncbi:MAG TPA: threonylcarbamoyl-AMP synthase [Chromatiales bacterium]|nr:threonylcarbamoyl-AMP synthase [Chromatiales bacterium]
MTTRLKIHPVNPQDRLARQAAEVLKSGGLIVYPTDSCYAFGCSLDAPASAKAIARIRQTGKGHNFTLVCRDLSEISAYARIPNWAYRLIRSHTPGPYTFILPATRDVPRRLQNPKRKTIGIRVPEHPVPMAILDHLGEPIMSSTLLMPGSDRALNDGDEIMERLAGQVDLVVDSGSCGIVPSTVVDLTGNYPEVLREGKGDASHFR